MKVQGITPEYVEAMLATRLRPTADELIAMKVHGVTPDYVDGSTAARHRSQHRGRDCDEGPRHYAAASSVRFRRPGLDIRIADDFIAARVHGITPEFVKTAIDHGFQDLTVDKLIMLRNTDVI